MKIITTEEIFGRRCENGIEILNIESGESVTRIDASVYPIDSGLSARYEHPAGIILSVEDCEKLGIEIE